MDGRWVARESPQLVWTTVRLSNTSIGWPLLLHQPVVFDSLIVESLPFAFSCNGSSNWPRWEGWLDYFLSSSVGIYSLHFYSSKNSKEQRKPSFQPLAIRLHNKKYCADVSHSLAYYFLMFILCPLGVLFFPLLYPIFIGGALLIFCFAIFHAIWFCFIRQDNDT